MDLPDAFSMDGRTAVITGGASGIGRGYAEAIAEAGGDVVIGDIDTDGANDVVSILEDEYGCRGLAVESDVREKSDVDELVETAKNEFGSVDAAFANAGIGAMEPGLERYDEDTWENIISTNLSGVFYMNRACSEVMKEQGHGSIINTASVWGVVGEENFGLYAYTSSKGGVIQLTRTMAANQAPEVRVNAIAPGAISTDIGGGFLKKEKGMDAVQDAIKRTTPMERIGEPDDLKGLALYLASDASSYCTGGVYMVDGGITAV